MKKKWKYYLITCISFLVSAVSVNASEDILFYEIDPAYRGKVEGTTQFQELAILTINDNIAYSLEAVNMPSQVIYKKNSDKLNTFTKEDLDYLEKIAYFGYDKESPNKKMYMAAQEIIWEYVNDVEVYWTDYNNIPVSVEDEKQLILEKITNLDKIPVFNTNKVSGKYFEDIVLTDTENVLKDFVVLNESSNVIQIEGNKLKIKVRETSSITLLKNFKNKADTCIYSAINSTDIITFGISHEVKLDLNISLTNQPSAYLNLEFLQNEKAINGVVEFKIDDKVYKTNEKGYFLSENLFDVGQYKIEIISIPNNYQINRKEFTITLLEKNINNERIISFEESLYEKFGMFHLYRAGSTLKEKEIPLKDIKYELYARENIYNANGVLIHEKDKKIESLKTNENGIVKFENLYMGRYYLKEITNTSFEKPNYDILFEITPTGENVYESLITNHKPLKIMIIGGEDLKYILYDSMENQITTLTTKETNILPVQYDCYSIKVLKDEKLLFTWEALYNEHKNEYVFNVKEYLDTIIFEMPETGRKNASYFGIICILLFLLKKVK